MIRKELLPVGDAQNEWLRQTQPVAKRLAVMLPGQNFPCSTGPLFYLRSLMLQRGFDLLAVEYGFQVTRTPHDLDQVWGEVRSAVDQALAAGYEEVCFIGKSMGSPIAAQLARESRDKLAKVSAILLTPVWGALDPADGLRALAIIGTDDPVCAEPLYLAARERADMEWLVLDGLNHGLNDPADWANAVAGLSELLRRCDGFLAGAPS